MNNEINPIEEDFNAALSRYKAGKDLISIVQDFQKIIQQIPIILLLGLVYHGFNYF